MNEKIRLTLDRMRARGFITHEFDSTSKMRDYVVSAIGSDKNVGIGGSVTVESLGLYEALCEAGNRCHFHWKVPPEERAKVIDLARDSDVYIMSSNAVSSDGAVLNIDGNGNRVAGLLNGPRIVFILLGINKFVDSREDAMRRVKEVACPANARRLKLSTPCALTGKCVNCDSPQRMCNYIVWTERPRRASTVHVCVVSESLGF